MAKTALLAQNDNLAIENLKQSVGRSVFDLSHTTTFPIDVDGAILPICCIETVPSDSFDISVECLLRQLSPLAVPLMSRFKLCTAFYYCDNRLAWKKWDRFMTGGRSGNETYDIPRVANIYFKSANNPISYDLADNSKNSKYESTVVASNIDYKNSLHTYFGISLNHSYSNNITDDSEFISSNEELPIAFPFFDYQLICRDFYTDIDRLKSSPTNLAQFDSLDSDWAYSNLFPPDDDEIKLIDGIQLVSGFQSGDDSVPTTHGFILDKVRYHNVRDDYFTTSKKAPMRGDVPELDTTVAVSEIDPSRAIYSPSTAQTFDLDGNNGSLVGLKIPDDVNNSQLASGIVTNVGGHDKLATDSALAGVLSIALSKIKINLETTKKINAAEIRLLSQLTVWQELNMLHKPYYNDFLNAHFDNVKVGDSAVERPIFIGGTSQDIMINEVLQTSASDGSSYLGNQGATMMSLANNHVGSFYCNNYGYIIGVAFIIPDLYYNPAMPRGFSRRTKEDFYSPEFANLSMQATLNKEIFFSNDDEWNNTPWGYTGAFDELRSIPNRIAGDLLNSSYQDLQAWVLRRNFTNDNKPAMSTSFLALKNNVDKTAWKVPTMPAFMLQCANYIKAVRPMPYVAIPKAL